MIFASDSRTNAGVDNIAKPARSNYETDRLSEIPWKLFGQTSMGWARVSAICDYVHRHLGTDEVRTD